MISFFVTAAIASADPLAAGWRGENVCEQLYENDRVRALKCAFAPGEGHERHHHDAHFGYILEGGPMRIRDAGGERILETRAGAPWWSNGVDWHEAVNVGETTTAYLIVEPKEATDSHESRTAGFHAALDAHIASIAARDVDAYADTLTERDDLQLIFPGGERIDGVEGVIDFHEDWFDDEKWVFSIEVLKTQVGADMAYAFTKTSYQDEEGAPPRFAWLVLVFALEDGEWKLVHDQNTRIPDEESGDAKE